MIAGFGSDFFKVFFSSLEWTLPRPIVCVVRMALFRIDQRDKH